MVDEDGTVVLGVGNDGGVIARLWWAYHKQIESSLKGAGRFPFTICLELVVQ